jgi:hypothetical protein
MEAPVQERFVLAQQFTLFSIDVIDSAQLFLWHGTPFPHPLSFIKLFIIKYMQT